MSPHILFLSSPQQPHNDNHVRLPEIFRQAGWQVTCADHEQLALLDNQCVAADTPLQNFDVIWPLGFGPAASFNDRMQLLSLAAQDKMMLPVQAFLLLHGKSAWAEFAPPSYTSMQVETLAAVVDTQPGAWVLKPNAGSLARNVHRVENPDQVRKLMAHTSPGYWLLQRYIPEITQGETRTLICHHHILGSYRRLVNAQGIANLAAGGRAVATRLNSTQMQLVRRVHNKLIAHRIGFAAIDTAGGYLVETNLANPGGLQTLSTLYGDTPDNKKKDYKQELHAAIVAAVSARHLPATPA